jgi:hypothetical protein
VHAERARGVPPKLRPENLQEGHDEFADIEIQGEDPVNYLNVK